MPDALAQTATLTRLHLNPREPVTTRDVADVHLMHRRVMDLFPEVAESCPRAGNNVLFRVEQTPVRTFVLVQSALPPSVDRLPDGYASRTESAALAPLLDRFGRGVAVRYRIVANPVSIRTTADGKKQRRWLHDDEAVRWWGRRAEEVGLVVRAGRITSEELLTGRRPKGAGGQRLCHGATRFDGVAAITDPELVRAAVISGIGRARSYGCGLLSLAIAGA